MKEKLTDRVTAPDFDLTNTQGKTIRLSDYRGRPVVLALLRGFM